MADINIHIGEMLARNGRMYPNDVALIERVSAEKKRTVDNLERIRRQGE